MESPNCKICEFPYDEADHRPRNSPCGHEICSACLRALIKNGIFECPTCRHKNIVNAPDDLPICFGIIDVIRAFKAENLSMSKENEPKIFVSTKDDLCKFHQKPIGHRCIKCELWVCEECIDCHPTEIGCSTITSYNAVSNIRKKQTNITKFVLNGLKEDAKYISYEIQNHNRINQELTDKIKEKSKGAEKKIKAIMEEAERQKKEILVNSEKQIKELLTEAKKHVEEVNKLNNAIEKGHLHLDKILETKKQIEITHSPYALIDQIEVFTQRMQFLYNYSVNSLGADSIISVLKALIEEKEVYATKDGNQHCKLSLHEGNICVHHLKSQAVPDNGSCIPYFRLQKLIPSSPSSLVFVEICLDGVVMGRVLIRLDKNTFNIRENIVTIVTGEQGQSLVGVKCDKQTSYFINTHNMQFSKMPVSVDSSARSNAKGGDVVGSYSPGYLRQILFLVSELNFGKSNDYKVIGSITSGMEIIQECHTNLSKGGTGLVITDCGIVIEHE